MKKSISVVLFLIFGLVSLWAQSLMDQLHGDEKFSYKGLHSGNMLRTNFYNDGMVGGGRNDPENIGGEWPINSGRNYLAKISMFIGAEVKDINGEVKHIVSEANGTAMGQGGISATSGDSGPNGEWWTFAPLPGFANDDSQRVSMSHWEWSWPDFWPDKYDDVVDPGWHKSWNGYFGKNILNADQESYYVMDDYLNKEWAFYPDSTDLSRRGLGLRVNVRGFQWSNTLVEDILFLLYDVKNIGTFEHDKMNFGLVCGPNIGSVIGASGDGEDDGGAYNLDEELGYQLDADDVGGDGFTPVGYLGLAFFESPGNPFDGIDNDGDGEMGSGPVITENMFEPKVFNVGDQVVLINYKTFERTVVPMPAEGVTITYLQKEYRFVPGQEYKEEPTNLIDDNLNGIVDECNGWIFGEGADAIHNYLYVGLKYIDYISGAGLDNILIDEERDDNIDNDGDWNILTDDVGLDGVPKTGDPGEGDGVPTSGRGTDLPGEPRIDKTDIDESDMIGLTAFNIFSPWTIYPLWDDEVLWGAMEPGFLNAYGQIGNTDILLGSGFFPIQPEQIERYSLGYIMGYHDELFRNKTYAEKTYLENYNFAKAPNIPTLTAIPGDGIVTLMWDDYAEKSMDPITGEDFEGYKIYRSTNPGFDDMLPITDAYGSVVMKKPLAQFDKDNGIQGLSNIHTNGIHFWLGEDTGIVHTFVDSTVNNGQLYYYAVSSYDRGSDSLGIAPSECSKYITISTDGKVDKGRNVVMARPEAPSAGYVPATFENVALLPGGTGTGNLGFKVIDPRLVKGNNTYRVVFEDTIQEISSRNYPATKNITVINITDPANPVTTEIYKNEDIASGDNLPPVDGFQLTLQNHTVMAVDSIKSKWNRNDIYKYSVQSFKYSKTYGLPTAADYRIEFGDIGLDTSTAAAISATRKMPATAVNFKITNLTTGKDIDFAFWERDELQGEAGKFTAFTDKNQTDLVIFLEPDKNDSLIFGWEFSLDNATNDSLHNNPGPGDYLNIYTFKPFLSNDVFEFNTVAEHIDKKMAKAEMDRIKVVPNPYIVSNSWEPINPYTNGRGPRELHFTHLPEKCTIRIFNIRGQLVREIEHNAPTVSDGTEIWDMQTKDLLDIAYGVYIYHIDAGEIGQKTGKFAVIK
ncbi:hypothetical protein JW935_23760 [candidate division KSB1 bacterium]|nr:hypothetical protein [candidate division KSB1 bacterium]